MLNRIIYSDNGTLSDITNDLKDYRTGDSSLTLKTTDAIYIGQRAPFNHLYFKLSALNVNAANIDVKIWDGTEFIAVAETIDETAAAGATLGQSGFITWVPNRDDAGWSSDDTDDMVELNDITIYDLYWVKITASALLSAVTLDWVGQKFSTDDDLYGEFPLFSRTAMKTAFESGKTSWEEQHVSAAKLIVQDLIKKGVINESGQILKREEFSLSAIQKVAELIFNGFGDDYEDDRLKAKAEYKGRLDKRLYKVDKDGDADLSNRENKKRSGFLHR